MNAILSIRDVSKSFAAGKHTVKALDTIDLDVRRGECHAIVGESGSGKSTLANLILGLLSPDTGEVQFDGRPLPTKRTLDLRKRIQFVQQNPLSALNSRRRIRSSVALPMQVHAIGVRKDDSRRVGELLEEVGLPADMAQRFPHALSGGQRQRVAIARALACEPELIVFDEPTSALDVLVQARILQLLHRLRKDRGLTYVFITHDLAVVRAIADRVSVFQKGHLVETSDVDTIFSAPKSAYTRQLLSAIPVVTAEEMELKERLLQL